MKDERTLIVQLEVSSRLISALAATTLVLALGFAGGTVLGQKPQVASNPAAQPTVAQAPEPPISVATLPDCGDDIPTINGDCISPETVRAVGPEVEVGALATGTGRRQVYVTQAYYPTDQALAACGTGYHMASLWEILNTSSWRYAYGHPAAFVKADSGQGPPSYWYGMVRTGSDSGVAYPAGTGNCAVWTTTSSGAYGVAVRLTNSWETTPGDIGTWDATSFACNLPGPVWCMED